MNKVEQPKEAEKSKCEHKLTYLSQGSMVVCKNCNKPCQPTPDSWEEEFDGLSNEYRSGKNSVGVEFSDMPIPLIKSFIKSLLKEEREKLLAEIRGVVEDERIVSCDHNAEDRKRCTCEANNEVVINILKKLEELNK